MTSAENLKQQFLLDPKITYLNFGAFGATPKIIFEKYQSYQRELEWEPVQFITQKVTPYLAKSRQALSHFINCDADDIVMVINPSYAVNTIARSLSLKEGDEILATNIEYGACDRAWNLICGQKGAKYIRQKVKLPLIDDNQFVEDLFSGVTPRTKLIFISHITSTTALILPVETVIKRAKSLGIPVFIDGAHVPGHIPLDIKSLDPDYYTGACHKWMMTPKGSSFMYVRRSLQESIYPLIVSWGFEAVKPSHSKYLDWHEMNGSRDYAAMLCIPEAIEFRKNNNWDEVALQSRALAHKNATHYADILNSQLLATLSDKYLSQMVSVPIKTINPDLLYQTLFNEFKIEIPVMQQDETVYLRYSINGFNTQEDLNILFDAIEQLKRRGLIG